MFEELNRQLEEVGQKVYRRNKLISMLEELKNRQISLKRKIEELKLILEKENAEVDKLEGKSITHLFYTVLGKLGEQMEKERQEALAATLKYNQAVSELNQLEEEIRQLESELIEYRNSQREFDDLYARKTERVLASNSQSGQRLLELSKQLKDIENNRRELKEAISAGQEVIKYIEGALKSLDSAEGWGTWDLIGGGLVSDLMKHSHIDDAKSQADMIQSKLLNFRAELADVRINNSISFETDGFGKFADFFFDGLIADWCMQSRIRESQSSIQNVKNQVQEVLRKLDSMEYSDEIKLEKLKSEIEELIQTA